MDDRFYLSVAETISRASKCLRGNWGTVIVKNDIVLGLGYNGPARGVKHCNPCRRDIYPPGKGYDKCIAAHSEVNALLQSGGRRECLGATLYLASHNRKYDGVGSYNKVIPYFPCDDCFRYVVNAGIKTVVVLHGEDVVRYEVTDVVDKLNRSL